MFLAQELHLRILLRTLEITPNSQGFFGKERVNVKRPPQWPHMQVCPVSWKLFQRLRGSVLAKGIWNPSSSSLHLRLLWDSDPVNGRPESQGVRELASQVGESGGASGAPDNPPVFLGGLLGASSSEVSACGYCQGGSFIVGELRQVTGALVTCSQASGEMQELGVEWGAL